MPSQALIARRIKVVDMAIGGATVRQIGETFKIGKSTAHRDLELGIGYLRAVTVEAAEEHRNLQSLRIDSLIRAHWLPATGRHTDGSPMPAHKRLESLAHAQLVLRLMHRQSRIHGSDLPDELRARRIMHDLATRGAAGDKLNLSVDQVRRIIAEEEAAAAAAAAREPPDEPTPPEPDDDDAA